MNNYTLNYIIYTKNCTLKYKFKHEMGISLGLFWQTISWAPENQKQLIQK